MKKELLFEALQDVDDALLRQSENRPKGGMKKWLALAACLCVAAVGALAVPGLRTAVHPPVTPTIPAVPTRPSEPAAPFVPEQPAAPIVPEEPSVPDVPAVLPGLPEEPTWSPVYNDAAGGIQQDAARRYDPGAFTEPMDQNELSAVLPEGELQAVTGNAAFSGQGELTRIILEFSVPVSLPDHRITAVISRQPMPRCYILPTEPEVTVCGDAEYVLYEFFTADGRLLLEAEGKPGGASCYFRLETDAGEESTARTQFEQALYLFSRYAGTPPELSAVTAEEIPEWFVRDISHAEALADETFGGLMPVEVPKGFAAESVRRFKNQSADYLSGLWTRGYDQLSWQVTRFAAADEGRVTSVADTKNYDMSLYPLPLAQSVPEDLWEIVSDPVFLAEELTLNVVEKRAYTAGEAGDSSNPRMNFSVRFGDYLVTVRAKGVEPKWIFAQLQAIGS